GFADTLTRSIISNALGHQPTEDDLSHPWDENSAACLEFVSETGTTHEVSILAFHAEGEAMTLADAADILLAALSTDALATVLDHAVSHRGQCDVSERGRVLHSSCTLDECADDCTLSSQSLRGSRRVPERILTRKPADRTELMADQITFIRAGNNVKITDERVI